MTRLAAIALLVLALLLPGAADATTPPTWTCTRTVTLFGVIVLVHDTFQANNPVVLPPPHGIIRTVVTCTPNP